jgi:hypothetical protein
VVLCYEELDSHEPANTHVTVSLVVLAASPKLGALNRPIESDMPIREAQLAFVCLPPTRVVL